MAYLPEGSLLGRAENSFYLRSIAGLEEARQQGVILEARAVVCDSQHNLIVDLGFTRGIIPRSEGALGIDNGTTRDIAIISKVNKPVCFTVDGFIRQPDSTLQPVLSRRDAQELCRRNYISTLVPGQIICGRVTHLEPFGAFVDIGCGLPSLIPIDQISVSRISHPRDRFAVGDELFAVVRGVEPEGRICLSHKELLGSWEQNTALFSPGETVAGVIRSVEDYGVFVELTPNLAGLAEPFGSVAVGQHASVYIKSILPEKMKIKLVLVDAFDADYSTPPMRYFLTEGKLTRWVYSPAASQKVIETVFAV